TNAVLHRMLEHGALAGCNRDDLDLRRQELEWEIVGVTGQDPDRQAEAERSDRGIERRAPWPNGLPEAIQRDVADRDEIRRAHPVIVSGVPSGSPKGGGRYTIVRPPDTDSVWPVMKPASSDARNTTAGATSPGTPRRPHGITRFKLSPSFGFSA